MRITYACFRLLHKSSSNFRVETFSGGARGGWWQAAAAAVTVSGGFFSCLWRPWWWWCRLLRHTLTRQSHTRSRADDKSFFQLVRFSSPSSRPRNWTVAECRRPVLRRRCWPRWRRENRTVLRVIAHQRTPELELDQSSWCHYYRLEERCKWEREKNPLSI